MLQNLPRTCKPKAEHRLKVFKDIFFSKSSYLKPLVKKLVSVLESVERLVTRYVTVNSGLSGTLRDRQKINRSETH